MKINDAIAGFNRLGNQNSKTWEKYRERAALIVGALGVMFRKDAELPRGYRLMDGAGYYSLVRDQPHNHGQQRKVRLRSVTWLSPKMETASLINLAEDINTGWLDEVAKQLGKQSWQELIAGHEAVSKTVETEAMQADPPHKHSDWAV